MRVDGVKVLNDVSFTVGREDKIAFLGESEIALTTLFKIITGELEPLIYMVIFLAIITVIIYIGVKKGIELSSRILMLYRAEPLLSVTMRHERLRNS